MPREITDIFQAIDNCDVEAARRFLAIPSTLTETKGKKNPKTPLDYITKAIPMLAKDLKEDQEKPDTPPLVIAVSEDRLQRAEQILALIMHAKAEENTKAASSSDSSEEDEALAEELESMRKLSQLEGEFESLEVSHAKAQIHNAHRFFGKQVELLDKINHDFNNGPQKKN